MTLPPMNRKTFFMGRPLARNISVLTVSRGITLFSGLAITAWLGRHLGPESFGIISFAAAVASYFSLIMGVGLETLGARDVARHPARIRVLASHIMSLRLFLAVIALLGLAVFVVFVDATLLVRSVIAVHGVGLVVFAISLDFVYQGQARMGVIASREIAVSLFTLLCVVILIRSPDHVMLAAVIMMASLVVGALLVGIRYGMDFGLPAIRIDWNLWRALYIAALPIAGSAILVSILRSLGTVMLGFLRSPAEVGFYATAVKFFSTALAPTMILLMAFTPALASAGGNIVEMRRVMEKFAAAISAAAAPIAAIGFFFAPELLTFLFGPAYLPAQSTARILMSTTLVASLGICFAHPLLLWGKQHQVILPLSVSVIVAGVLNFLLVPRLGIVGAAVATLAAELVLVVWFFVKQARLGVWLVNWGLVGTVAAAFGAGFVAHYVAHKMLNIFAANAALPMLLVGPALGLILYVFAIAPFWWHRILGSRQTQEKV